MAAGLLRPARVAKQVCSASRATAFVEALGSGTGVVEAFSPWGIAHDAEGPIVMGPDVGVFR